jgi:hypothetical protein
LAEEVDTVGGLIVTLAGRVPSRSELIAGPDQLEFEVLDADPRRVKRLRIHRRPGGAAPPRAVPRSEAPAKALAPATPPTATSPALPPAPSPETRAQDVPPPVTTTQAPPVRTDASARQA